MSDKHVLARRCDYVNVADYSYLRITSAVRPH